MASKINFHTLERIIRGFSNHRRLAILFLLADKPELSVHEIAKELKINFKTASEHIRRLATAGLVIKRYQGQSVCHKITPRAELVLKFIKQIISQQ